MIYNSARVGLDIDGVLADFGSHFLSWYGLPTHKPDSWDDKRFTENFHKCHNDKDFWLSIPAISGVEIVNIISPVAYITARPIPNDWSMEWLWDNGFPSATVITVGPDKSKVQAIKDLKIDLFVDDAIHNFEDILSSGTDCLLMTRSHNRDYDAKDKRVGSLYQVVPYIAKKKQRQVFGNNTTGII